MKQKKLIVIIGPTAAKKTTLAHYIASKLNGAIINADAFQVYQELNVGINKPSIEQLKEIPYYLINNITYTDEWNISIFKNQVDNVYNQIIANKQLPILCGGSHLYIDCIVKGYGINKIDDDSNLLNEISHWSNNQLHDYIKQYDYESYKKISINNRKRLLRCVYLLKLNNNIPKSKTDIINNSPQYDCLIIMVTKDREILYNDINNRFDNFINNKNWINEVKQLITKYPNIIHSNAFKAIGYTEIANHILYNVPLNLSQLKKKTRVLAKQQITWCKNKFENKIIFNYNKDNVDDLIENIKSFYYG